jgi:hypothetical protein
LQVLQLNLTKVADADLEHLQGLTGLKVLGLAFTDVTEAGVRALQKALPDVKIKR